MLFRQLIFTELPATLENFVGERMQGFKKMVDTLEKRLEASRKGSEGDFQQSRVAMQLERS